MIIEVLDAFGLLSTLVPESSAELQEVVDGGMSKLSHPELQISHGTLCTPPLK